MSLSSTPYSTESVCNPRLRPNVTLPLNNVKEEPLKDAADAYLMITFRAQTLRPEHNGKGIADRESEAFNYP